MPRKKTSKAADPNSLFTLIDAPALPPGVDFITRTDKGPFLDTHKTLDFTEWKSGSRVYLAESTVREMAEAFGLFDTSDETQAKLDAAYKEGYEDALKENLGGTIARALDDLGFVVDRLADLDGRVRDVVVDAILEGTAEIAEERAGDSEPDAASDDSPAGQEHGPAGKQGRADLSGITGDELTLSI